VCVCVCVCVCIIPGPSVALWPPTHIYITLAPYMHVHADILDTGMMYIRILYAYIHIRMYIRIYIYTYILYAYIKNACTYAYIYILCV
jgi:hypothetical protein